MLTYVAINKPVASIQMDITCTAQPVIAPGITSKSLACNQVTPGVWRCVVFGLNRDAVAIGRIIDVPGVVTGISSVTAADADGEPVSVTPIWVSQPRHVRARTIIQ